MIICDIQKYRGDYKHLQTNEYSNYAIALL